MQNLKQNRQKSLSSRQSARHKQRLATAVMGVAAAGFASRSKASILTWDGGNGAGSWDTTTLNWNNDSVAWPGTTNTALFNGTSATTTATLNTNVTAGELQFTGTGYTINGSGTLSLSGGIDASTLTSGTTTINNPVTLTGAQTWGVGSGATLAVGGVISGGTNLLSTSAAAGATGTITLSSTGNTIGGLELNNGTVDLTGSLTLSGQYSYFSNGVGLSSSLIIDTNANLTESGTATNNFTIGREGGTSTVTQNAGSTFSFNPSGGGDLYIDLGGGVAGTSGTYNLNGGTLKFNGYELAMAYKGGTSTLNVTSGSITNIGTFYVGIASTSYATNATVNQSGGSVTMTGSNTLILANGSGIAGTYNLGGGTLTVAGITTTGGISTFNFNGGTLAADQASTTFMTGLTTASVNANSTIDNGGFAITIGQALAGAAGLTFQGSGVTTLSGTNAYSGGQRSAPGH
jgi:fibronectin-binding autotransporter adhesin